MLRRTLTGLVALGLISTGLIVVASAAVADPGQTWSLSADAVANPSANPFPDQYGNADVWSYLAGTGTDPSQFSLLSHETSDVCGPGVDRHDTGSDVPVALVNTTSNDHPCRSDIKDQAGGVSVHPSPSTDAIVGWTSPVTASVTFSGGLADEDPNGGNGFTYTVLHNSTVVASGLVFNADSVNLGPITMSVAAGDTVDVLVDARDGDYTYDTTAVNELFTTQPPPTATSSSPVNIADGTSKSVTISGANFTPNTTVALDVNPLPQVTIGAPTARTSTSITVPVSVASNGGTGTWHWTIDDPALAHPVTCLACKLTLVPTPKIYSLNPSSIPRGQSTQVTINGDSFTKHSVKVKVSGAGVTVTVNTINYNYLIVTMYVDPAQAPGVRTVTVIDQGGGKAVDRKALTIT